MQLERQTWGCIFFIFTANIVHLYSGRWSVLFLTIATDQKDQALSCRTVSCLGNSMINKRFVFFFYAVKEITICRSDTVEVWGRERWRWSIQLFHCHCVHFMQDSYKTHNKESYTKQCFKSWAHDREIKAMSDIKRHNGKSLQKNSVNLMTHSNNDRKP